MAHGCEWCPVCVWQPCERLSRVNLNSRPDEPPVTLNMTSGYKKSISHGLTPQYIPAISKRYLVSNTTHVTPTSLKQMWWISWKEYLTSMSREQHRVSPLLRGLILSILTDSSCNPILRVCSHPESSLDATVTQTHLNKHIVCAS